jgi:hypothetical protein
MDKDDDADSTAALECRKRLVEYISTVLQSQASLELFACWDGDQEVAPELRSQIHPSDLLTGRTYFQEGEFVLLSQ